MQHISEMINNAYVKYQFSLQRESCFQTVHFIKQKRYGIKVFKLCNLIKYICDVKLYLAKDQYGATQDLTAMLLHRQIS
jgi:hypothetical protein